MTVLQALPLRTSIVKLMLNADKAVTLLGQTVSPSPLLSLALSHNKSQTSLEVRPWGAMGRQQVCRGLGCAHGCGTTVQYVPLLGLTG